MNHRILHTSDIHLESLHTPSSDAFDAVINLAITTKIDLMIVAGDLFERNKTDNNMVAHVLQQLKRLSAWVVILPGNHDCLNKESVYLLKHFWGTAPRVKILTSEEGETLLFHELNVAIWGKPITSYDSSIKPLGGVPRITNRDDFYRIAIAHGSYIDTQPPAFPSLQITPEEIVGSKQDYIAMGHQSTYSCICNDKVKAFYSGSPSVAGTVNIIDLSDGTISVNRCPLK